MIIILNVIIVILLVFMNGFFVATEFAMVKVRKSRIETLAMEGNRNAKHTLKVVKDLNSYLSACQLGITLASLGLGWVGEPAFAEMLRPLINLFNLPEITLHSISVVLGFSIITGLHIVLGELAPKSLAIINTENIAMYTALPLIAFYRLTYPIMWTFNHSTNLVLKIFGISQIDEQEAAHTDEEIKLLVEDSYKHGLIDQTELTFVDNIFDFSEKTVRDIMIPRTDMACIFIEDTFDEIINYALEEQLTRYPVCRDSKDNVIGFIHIKDLYKLKFEGSDNIEGIIREIKFVPESLSISELFKTFKKEKAQMAIIIDEFGGTAGLVTTEDILEEIVGEIQDEFDDDGEEEIRETDNGSYVVDGKVLIGDINELLDTNIEAENIDTIGGWIYSQLKSYPKPKEKVNYGNYEFIILKCDRKRINQVLIKNLSE
ncbi:hemolysin family protein [Clostridium beijerinckii]|uniref:CBS domain containing-hemolysin-like protein n=1 Tax=Clostridium beijerinckii TaxID=1520 RepID=A0AAX0B9E6_CLOBE|nr:hemolysin family protein [Clostridium beijerinckii]MBA8933349.1 CBS domain containing-hemolysin-like protein [Clostridium beijerinckii]NOW05691.1 CBS domain containing-hemolysin-like protein [Clostridium beijerinckii]NRT36704.1 CBS domain containing-hemolysin-like protein [Clostridium beijerinckii]NRT43863.1 CBS domain containing-hemolysin-like protein [Clostridium beijerinckii]NRT91771.1 CBS domain containing-hemolysin-like protein [Clostridium beijerinckii]